ncbi:hypothetical protein GCM10007423_39830 [Dyadobacter endophyticus]|uniref:Uncharacterized protein n=1 Tax=Dyadobacter endophyticus TaxID=1749036 RepID=A0ABQ1Z0Q8_9BACT|nr:hypothetical protein [Dyadobacter endophyticus]GGH42865.1 hypothetical protein GCM10007423_39830 [Dyadobacter endophyticus]
MKKFIALFFSLSLLVGFAANAQNWRIYRTTGTQIRIDSANGGLHKISSDNDLKVTPSGSKIGFTFTGFGLKLLPSQVLRADGTTYGTTVSDVIAAFVTSADLVADQAIINSTTTGTLAASTYSYIEVANDHASAASSIVVAGQTVSIPAGKSLIFKSIRSPKTGRYKPIPAIAYTATGSSLRIYTIKE